MLSMGCTTYGTTLRDGFHFGGAVNFTTRDFGLTAGLTLGFKDPNFRFLVKGFGSFGKMSHLGYMMRGRGAVSVGDGGEFDIEVEAYVGQLNGGAGPASNEGIITQENARCVDFGGQFV